MVKTEGMGQGVVCGVSSPGVESLPLIHPSSTSTSTNGIATEVQESLTSLLSTEGSINLDDMVIKLRTVINENLELKETVAQNNLALRQQLGLVVQWREQNDSQQQKLRQEVTQAVTQLTALHNENTTLKAQLAGAKVPAKDQSRFTQLTDTINSLTAQLQVVESSLQQEREEKEKIAVQRSRLEGDVTLLKCDLTTSRSEQERLQLERLELLSAANDLRQQLRQAREGSAKVKSAAGVPVGVPEGVAVGVVGVEGELHKLQNQLRKEQDTSMTLLQELQDTRTQVEALEGEVRRAQEEASMHREICRNLQQGRKEEGRKEEGRKEEKKDEGRMENKRLREEAAMLREEVDTLENALSSERQKMSDERAALSRAHNEITKLKKEIQDVKDTAERHTNNDQYYQVKMRSMNEKHDEAMAKLMSYEELLAAKNDDLAKLKKELGQTKAALAERASESETIAILRAQVEVYQGDFRAEREAREALATDREKLRDELRHLHTRNTQLVDELEAYQRRTLQPGAGGSRGPSEERGAGGFPPSATGMTAEALWDKLSNSSDKKEDDKKKEEEIDENLFYCPKCNKSFTQYRPLEDHVNRCLDQD